MDRENGFKEALNDNIEEVVAIQDGKGELQTAMEPAENILQAHPDLMRSLPLRIKPPLDVSPYWKEPEKRGKCMCMESTVLPDGKKGYAGRYDAWLWRSVSQRACGRVGRPCIPPAGRGNI